MVPLREHTQGRKTRRVPVPRPVAGVTRVRRVGCVWRVERWGTDGVPRRGAPVVRSVSGVWRVGVALARVAQLTWVPYVTDLVHFANISNISNVSNIADVTDITDVSHVPNVSKVMHLAGIMRRMVRRSRVRVTRRWRVGVSLVRRVRCVALVRVRRGWTVDATVLFLGLGDLARVAGIPGVPRVVSVRRPSAKFRIGRMPIVGDLVAMVVQLRRARSRRRAARNVIELALVYGAIRDD